MSGHSKWSTIKHKKGKADAERGKVFTRVIKEITIAARSGGGDPAGNPRLRTAILAAKAANMPASNIDRAIKKGTGELEGVNYEEIIYEGYGPSGVAILAETVTDNRNRTTGELRHAFTKYGGNLGEVGCVSWMFETRGVITIPRASVDEDTLITIALDAGALDVKTEMEEAYEVITAFGDLEKVGKALADKKVAVGSSEVQKIAQNLIHLDEKEGAQLLKLLDALEEQDDVQKVFSNFEMSDEVMAKLSAAS